MLSITKSSILALVALTSLALSSPLDPRMEAAGYSMLGYRTVSKAEATSINKAGELTDNSAFNVDQQLGIRKSLSGSAGQWKLWTPKEKFFTTEATVVNYIKTKGLDATKTLQFAQVQGKSFNELFVPSTIVASGGSDIVAEFYNSMAALTAGMKAMGVALTTIDYTTATYAGPKS